MQMLQLDAAKSDCVNRFGKPTLMQLGQVTGKHSPQLYMAGCIGSNNSCFVAHSVANLPTSNVIPLFFKLKFRREFQIVSESKTEFGLLPDIWQS